MCGIFGIATPVGTSPALDDRACAILRDVMTHRGPDGAGLIRIPNAVLGHRRLTIRDHTDKSAQPIASHGWLTFNGELYNVDELVAWLLSERGSLAPAAGPVPGQVPGQVAGDAPLLAALLGHFGPLRVLPRLRGMYAFGWLDAAGETLVLARDPLGIKPLYYTCPNLGGLPHVCFASEVRPLAQLLQSHGQLRPDAAACSAYLTTIRTNLGSRTLFEGISLLQPGEVITFDLRRQAAITRSQRRARSCAIEPVDGQPSRQNAPTVPTTPAQTYEIIKDSVEAHLISSVPICSLLSGGLDSTIITSLAANMLRTSGQQLATYSIGPDHNSESPQNDDGAFAALAASALATRHRHVTLSREEFFAGWESIIQDTGLPLSTPNEVAIRRVSRVLAADGFKVALSGEGADELFGGYDGPLEAAYKYIQASGPHASEGGAQGSNQGGDQGGGLFALNDAAWIPLHAKSQILSDHAWHNAHHDAPLVDWAVSEFTACQQGQTAADPAHALQSHLRLMQSVNLAGLLLRLDSTMMLEGVEGRTPFADIRVAAFANSLSMEDKFCYTARQPRTKLALRAAFAGFVPPEILHRPKASFPVPFAHWMSTGNDNMCEKLRCSSFAADFFSPPAIAAVASQPGNLWSLAWPMINLAAWGKHWWP